MIEASVKRQDAGFTVLSVMVDGDVLELYAQDGSVREKDERTLYCACGQEVELNLPAEDKTLLVSKGK
jgi:hypothetical protein